MNNLINYLEKRGEKEVEKMVTDHRGRPIIKHIIVYLKI